LRSGRTGFRFGCGRKIPNNKSDTHSFKTLREPNKQTSRFARRARGRYSPWRNRQSGWL